MIQCADRAVGSQVNAPLLERAVEKLAVWKVELDEEIKVRGIRPHCSQQQSCSAAISMLSSHLGGGALPLNQLAHLSEQPFQPQLAGQPLLASPC